MDTDIGMSGHELLKKALDLLKAAEAAAEKDFCQVYSDGFVSGEASALSAVRSGRVTTGLAYETIRKTPAGLRIAKDERDRAVRIVETAMTRWSEVYLPKAFQEIIDAILAVED